MKLINEKKVYKLVIDALEKEYNKSDYKCLKVFLKEQYAITLTSWYNFKYFVDGKIENSKLKKSRGERPYRLSKLLELVEKLKSKGLISKNIGLSFYVK